MMRSTGIVQEKKDQRKAKRVAIWIHAILFVGFAFPFMSHTLEEEPKYESVIEIDFTDFQSSAAKSSTKKATPDAPKPVEEPKLEVKPTPKAAPTAKHKPVIETKSPEAPKIKTAPKVSEQPKKTPKVEVIPADKAPETPVEEVVEVAEEAPKATSGTPSDAGEGTSGTSDTGNAETDGKADKGDSGMDFSGDGLFTRRVIYRADIKKLAQEEGKIVVNLCVNNEGKVIYTEFNPEESTINSPKLVNRAQLATRKYRFERDYTAPTKQCGKLTFLFVLE